MNMWSVDDFEGRETTLCDIKLVDMYCPSVQTHQMYTKSKHYHMEHYGHWVIVMCLGLFNLQQQNTLDWVIYKKSKFIAHSSGGLKPKIETPDNLVSSEVHSFFFPFIHMHRQCLGHFSPLSFHIVVFSL